MTMKLLGIGLLKIQQNFGRCGTKSSAREFKPMLRCLVVIQTNRLQRSLPLTLKLNIIHLLTIQLLLTNFCTCKSAKIVASNGKTADADKLCTEISIELKIWDTF